MTSTQLSDIESLSSNRSACIEVQNLKFVYPGKQDLAIKDLNFSIPTGEIFGFLGPSGAGKSTTQKILIRLLRHYQGEVSVLGRELKTWDQDYYEQIGVGFELPNHYLKLTALENLNYFRSLYQRETRDPRTLLEQVGLAEDGNTRVSQFSKGMKMRLNLVRALLHDPQILFLDEPTSGLDPVNAQRVKQIILEQQQQGKTIFLTTHDMAVADELCDRVAFIVEGEIVLIDSPQTLKLQYGERKVRIEYIQEQQRVESSFPLEAIGDNSEFLQILRDYPVRTIHTQETTLERIFIQVTGKTL